MLRRIESRQQLVNKAMKTFSCCPPLPFVRPEPLGEFSDRSATPVPIHTSEHSAMRNPLPSNRLHNWQRVHHAPKASEIRSVIRETASARCFRNIHSQASFICSGGGTELLCRHEQNAHAFDSFAIFFAQASSLWHRFQP